MIIGGQILLIDENQNVLNVGNSRATVHIDKDKKCANVVTSIPASLLEKTKRISFGTFFCGISVYIYSLNFDFLDFRDVSVKRGDEDVRIIVFRAFCDKMYEHSLENSSSEDNNFTTIYHTFFGKENQCDDEHEKEGLKYVI